MAQEVPESTPAPFDEFMVAAKRVIDVDRPTL